MLLQLNCVFRALFFKVLKLLRSGDGEAQALHFYTEQLSEELLNFGSHEVAERRLRVCGQ